MRGDHHAGDMRLALVVARFNDRVTDGLLEGAVRCLKDQGAGEDGWTVLSVPGAWEIPQAARHAAGSGRYDGVVALGALVRGETTHFDWIAGEVARGLGEVTQRLGVPTGFGVLTTETMEQAVARSGGDAGNKGYEACLAVIELINLFRDKTV